MFDVRRSFVSSTIRLDACGRARVKLQNIKQRTTLKTWSKDRRISNKKFRMMKYGIASLSLFSKLIMIENLTSLFAFSEFRFLVKLAAPWPGVKLTPETWIFAELINSAQPKKLDFRL